MICVSPGISIGKAYLFKKNIIKNRDCSTKVNFDEEIKRFESSIQVSISQLKQLYTKLKIEGCTNEAEIFSVQISLIEDPLLRDKVEKKILDEELKLEDALQQTIKEIAAVFENMDDEYMSERVTDIRDVGERLLNNVFGKKNDTLEKLREPVIVVAKDLTPSDTVSIQKDKILGILTEKGGKTSHTAILAKMLEIPAIVGIGKDIEKIKKGDYLIIDGYKGKYIISPSKEAIRTYRKKKRYHKKQIEEENKFVKLPALTNDNVKIKITANIGSTEEAKYALKKGAEGIGLLRTEFLYLRKKDLLPTEQEQFEEYKSIAVQMKGNPVIIRTMDIGGDKQIDSFKIPQEMNPFLGWRAIRISLDRIELLKPQLRAILRASHFGKIYILFPMIISLEEIVKLKKYLNECKIELFQEGIAFDKDIQIGIMMETPAAALLADKLIKEVDFFSIGTNDLTQYTLAVDRGNEHIASLYQPTHPAVLKLIKMIIDASHSEKKWTGVCGEIAGNVKFAKLLLGMGIDELSMNSSSILNIKNAIRSSSFESMKKVAENVLKKSTTKEVHEYLEININ